MKGRGIGKFTKGERVTTFAEIQVGDLLVSYATWLDALNLIVVTALDTTGLGREIFYWKFADGDGGGRVLPGGYTDPDLGYSMWGHEFDGGRATRKAVELYRAVPPAPERKGDLMTINNVQELMDYYGAATRRELDRQIGRQLGARSASVCVMGALGADSGFVVNAESPGGDSVNNMFLFPLEEATFSLGMTELLVQVNPEKAEREGEEFMFALGAVRAGEGLKGGARAESN